MKASDAHHGRQEQKAGDAESLRAAAAAETVSSFCLLQPATREERTQRHPGLGIHDRKLQGWVGPGRKPRTIGTADFQAKEHGPKPIACKANKQHLAEPKAERDRPPRRRTGGPPANCYGNSPFYGPAFVDGGTTEKRSQVLASRLRQPMQDSLVYRRQTDRHTRVERLRRIRLAVTS